MRLDAARFYFGTLPKRGEFEGGTRRGGRGGRKSEMAKEGGNEGAFAFYFRSSFLCRTELYLLS